MYVCCVCCLCSVFVGVYVNTITHTHKFSLLLAGGGVFQGGTSVAARQRGRAFSPRNVSPICEGIHIRHTYKGIHIRHKSYI